MSVAPDSETPLHVGVFDSGVGGLSVLKALREAMPTARLSYHADSPHAPYGERDTAHVVDRSLRIAEALQALGARALVVACNTATALAIDILRERWPQLPIVGVEPGLKPAVALSRTRRVAVLATPATLRSARFQRLVDLHSQDCEVISQPCPGLAARIEEGRLQAPDLAAMVKDFCRPLRDQGIDAAVLGCTHYPFARPAIEAALGEQIRIVDTAEAVARQAAVRCAPWAGSSAAGETVLLTHGDRDRLERLAGEWLPFACRFDEAPAALR